jgi:hypothetical protein
MTTVKINWLKYSMMSQGLIVAVNMRNSEVKQNIPRANEINLNASIISSSLLSQCLHLEELRQYHAYLIESEEKS